MGPDHIVGKCFAATLAAPPFTGALSSSEAQGHGKEMRRANAIARLW